MKYNAQQILQNQLHNIVFVMCLKLLFCVTLF